MAQSLLILCCLFVLSVSGENSTTPTTTTTTTSVTGESNANCAYKENCNAEDGHLASINCRSSECTCVPGSDQYSCDILDLSSTDIQNAEDCKELCKETEVGQTDGSPVQCVFYKFEQFAPIVGSRCYLMGAEQCDQFSGQKCQESHCQSGVAKEGECDPDPPSPDQYTCPLGLTEEGLMFDDNKIHWFCQNAQLEVVDVYRETTAPGGTVCKTDHKCSLFDAEDAGGEAEYLQYACVLKAGSDPVKGEWQDLAGTVDGHDEAALSDDGHLVEPSCDCDPLILDPASFSQEGLMIQCTEAAVDEAKPSIPAPNHCLLLCDYYSVLHIFTDWKRDTDGVDIGEQTWYYRLAGDPDDGNHDVPIDLNDVGNVVRCWV